MVKLTIKQISKETNEVIGTRETNCKDINRALDLIGKIDAAVSKEHLKFQYTIEDIK